MRQDRDKRIIPPNQGMASTQEILERYGLTLTTAAQYIDAITRLNQTETADEINVSRETIRQYKNKFGEMTSRERLQIIASLAQEKLLSRADPQ